MLIVAVKGGLRRGCELRVRSLAGLRSDLTKVNLTLQLRLLIIRIYYSEPCVWT